MTMLQIFSGYAVFVFPDLIGRSVCYNPSPGVSAARSHVDHIIGIADDIEIVFNHNDRCAVIEKCLKNAE